jgi:hypothetical protein
VISRHAFCWQRCGQPAGTHCRSLILNRSTPPMRVWARRFASAQCDALLSSLPCYHEPYTLPLWRVCRRRATFRHIPDPRIEDRDERSAAPWSHRADRFCRANRSPCDTDSLRSSPKQLPSQLPCGQFVPLHHRHRCFQNRQQPRAVVSR